MRISKVEVLPIKVPKKTAFKVAYATRTAALSILVRITTDEGLSGWGEAVPVAEVTGEIRNEVYRALTKWVPSLIGSDPFDREFHRLALDQAFPKMPSAKCAVDSALWDLRGQEMQAPLFKILGAARQWHWASMSVGIKDTAETVNEVHHLLEQGFRDIKIKVGLDPTGDVERIKTLRRELGREFRLYLDANQGYTPREALDVLNSLASEEIEFIEQPVKYGDLVGLGEVTANSPIPVAADEAVKGPSSLIDIIRHRAAHMINVKLMKCGGPTNAELLIRMAEAAGMKAMVGCMIETNIGITAGLSVALGLNNVQYIDLDGALDLSDDIVMHGGAKLHSGKQYLEEGAGLGIVVDEEKVRRYRDEEAVL